MITRALTDRSQVLNAIDDLAFCIVKVRIRFQSEAASWSVYQSFCRGFIDNLRFLQTGDTRCRERAVQHYQHAVDSEPGYLLARYNLANLLYNRYTQLDNSNAIEHFRVAAEQATDDELRALSLSGLTMAYCQNVHRFGLGADPWVDLATTSSETAIQIRPNLAEASLARAFAHQVAGNYPGAIEEYQHAASLPGDDPIGRQIRSFADNNRAWLYMTKRGDLDTALKILTDAAHLYPNKMIFANMGEAHLRRGDFEEALQAYNNALRLDPRYSNAINEAALVYLALASTASDDQTRTKYRIEADRWHHRALATLPPNVPEQRDAVERTFAEGVVRYAP